MAKKYMYTVSTDRAPRGTAGAAERIKPLQSIVEEIGGEVKEVFVMGPYLYASVSMTRDQAQALRTYECGWISEVYQQQQWHTGD